MIKDGKAVRREMKSLGRDPYILVIGIGNQGRGDDGVGLLVSHTLAAKHLAHTSVVEETGEGGVLLSAWKGADAVILIDAVSSGASPGTLYRFDAQAQSVPAKFFRFSTHTFGVAEAIELARALNQLPPRLTVYGIEGKTFDAGIGLSPEVVAAARAVVKSVADEVRAMLPRRSRARARPDLKVSARI
jgi:hydrogenase maturation protease